MSVVTLKRPSRREQLRLVRQSYEYQRPAPHLDDAVYLDVRGGYCRSVPAWALPHMQTVAIREPFTGWMILVQLSEDDAESAYVARAGYLSLPVKPWVGGGLLVRLPEFEGEAFVPYSLLADADLR